MGSDFMRGNAGAWSGVSGRLRLVQACPRPCYLQASFGCTLRRFPVFLFSLQLPAPCPAIFPTLSTLLPCCHLAPLSPLLLL